MNKICLVGRFTKDPVMSRTPSGEQYVQYTVACNSRKKDVDGNRLANFFFCTSWGKQAENIIQFCKKGSLVQIFGEMNSSTYESEGRKLTSWKVDVFEIEFLLKGEDGDQDKKESAPSGLTPIADEDDDLPF